MKRRLADRFWWVGVVVAAAIVLVTLALMIAAQARTRSQTVKNYERGAEIQAQLDSYCLGQRTAVRQIEETARHTGAPIVPGPGCLLHNELPKKSKS